MAHEILVVEDSSTQAMLLKEMLIKNDFLVSIAKDGQDALEQMTRKKPDLIISDIEMPRMNGFVFCKNVKADPNLSAIPLILLTNLSDSMDVIEGIKSGADSFLTKPCTPEILLSTMKDILHNQKPDNTLNHVLEFTFQGKQHSFNINLARVTNLLLSTYASAIQKNKELEQAYQKLTIGNNELQRLNEQKNLFLGMAAHDLRSPLIAIQGYSELLLESLEMDADTRKMLSRIHTSSNFMLHLVNDLLDLSAIESGKVKLNLKETNLHDLIEECIALNTREALKKEIRISYNAKPIPNVQCDPEKLEQVVNNLITNAIKYSEKKTEIQVLLSQSDQDAVIAVKDQGVGISEDDLKKLFLPFSKGGSKSTQGELSTGLGLAIAKRIILEQKGDISVESQTGKGSSFFVKLPLRQ